MSSAFILGVSSRAFTTGSAFTAVNHVARLEARLHRRRALLGVVEEQRRSAHKRIGPLDF
jgi:hypothetical protein